jgi:gamma-glutamyltranspeptidase
MHCFNLLPGHVNSIAPGKARANGITPTIIMKDDKVVMIVGARISVSGRASSQAVRGAA